MILGAGKAQAAFIQFCVADGHDVYLADGDKNALSHLLLQKNVNTKLIDITNADEVLSYAKQISPDAVIAPSNDAGLIAATAVADYFGIPGPGIFATQNSRNKYEFRKLLKATGLTSPWFLHAKKSNIEYLSAEIPSYPCVIKPVQGSGSKGVRYLGSAPELKSYLHDSLNNSSISEYQVEEFIEGVEYSVEGMVQNGNLMILAICEKMRSPLPNLVDTRVSYPPRLQPREIEVAKDMTNKIITALKVENAPIHLEFIQSPTKGFVVVECAVRAAGFNLFNRMVPWCTGIDTLEAQLNLILGIPLRNIEPIREYAGILEFPQPQSKGILKSINYQKPTDSEVLTEIETYKKIGEIVAPASNGAERVGHIFIFSKSSDKAEEILESLKFSIELEDSPPEEISADKVCRSNHA